jgi:hypothetical protein
MLIYLFWSQSDTTVSGLTLDAEGKNLPSEFAPWSKNDGGQPIYTDADISSGQVSNSIVQAVRRDGFYLFRAGQP